MELLALWKTYDQKLEENLVLNRRNAEDITRLKIKSLLGSMKPMKIFTILVGILWVVLVDVIIVLTWSHASWFFTISAIIQSLLTKLSIGVYIYQMVLINQTDISEPLLETQERIARLQSSTLWMTRLMFLQFPVWTTFYISKPLLIQGGPIFYLIQIPVTIGLTALGIWFFRNIRYENRNKKWFRLIFRGNEWEPTVKAMEMLKEIEGFKN